MSSAAAGGRAAAPRTKGRVGAPSVEYDPRLLEDAVRAALDAGVRGLPPARLSRVRLDARRRLDRAYCLEEGEERERAFRATFRHLFDKLRLDRPLAVALEPFPQLVELDGILARHAPERDGVSADLWEHRERRGQGVPAFLVASIPPERFRDPAALERTLLPEMQRAADLMSPEFGFRREARVLGSRAVDPAIRRVYESLWDLSARVRLGAAGRIEAPDPRAEAEVLAGRASSAITTEVVDLCARHQPPTHDDLLDLAGRLVAGDEVDDPSTAPAIGQDRAPHRRRYRSTYERRCPLCRFPSCEWAGTESLETVSVLILADHPDWSSDQGACAHCAERYTLLGSTRARLEKAGTTSYS